MTHSKRRFWNSVWNRWVLFYTGGTCSPFRCLLFYIIVNTWAIFVPLYRSNNHWSKCTNTASPTGLYEHDDKKKVFLFLNKWLTNLYQRECHFTLKPQIVGIFSLFKTPIKLQTCQWWFWFEDITLESSCHYRCTVLDNSFS